MSLSDTFENDLLKLIFQGTPIANLADNAASGPLANLYLALHTADPGDAGTQATSEVTYTSYARAPVARSAAGFTVPTTGVSNLTANIDFAAGTGGTGTATYFSVGVAVSGATKILFSGPISPSIITGTGVIPRLTTATTFSLD